MRTIDISLNLDCPNINCPDFNCLRAVRNTLLHFYSMHVHFFFHALMECWIKQTCLAKRFGSGVFLQPFLGTSKCRARGHYRAESLKQKWRKYESFLLYWLCNDNGKNLAAFSHVYSGAVLSLDSSWVSFSLYENTSGEGSTSPHYFSKVFDKVWVCAA